MDRIDSAVKTIVTTLQHGRFTKADLEGIKMLAQGLINTTDKVLARIDKPEPSGGR